jgi:hypothetical protein
VVPEVEVGFAVGVEDGFRSDAEKGVGSVGW